MRVLWFTNVPLPAVVSRLASGPIASGGWMEGLRVALRDQSGLELGIASVSEGDYPSFVEDGTTYFNIPRPLGHSGLVGIHERWTHPIDIRGGIERSLEIIREFDPDLIHVHGTEGFFGLLRQWTEAPVVISIQGLLTQVHRAYWRGLGWSDLVRVVLSPEFLKGRALLHEYWRIRKAALREVRIINLCSNFIGRTEWDRAALSILNPTSRYFLCDEVLQPPFYTRRWDSSCAAGTRILCVSTPAPYKGLECVLEAAAHLRDLGVPALEIRIVGPIRGTPIWPMLLRKVRRLGIEGSVSWIGFKRPEEVAQEMCEASVFVLGSHVENSPNALAEAMLVGTPCVASFVGGVPSMIRDGEEGLLYPSGDALSLACKIARVLGDHDLAVRLSANARSTAAVRHLPSRIAGRMMHIYREIAGVREAMVLNGQC